MKATKIVHVTQAVGGVRTYINNIIEYKSEGFDHCVITSEQPYYEELKGKGIETYLLPMHRRLSPANLFAVIKLYRLLKSIKPDIVHSHSAIGGGVGRMIKLFIKKVPVYYTPHAFSYLSFKGLKRNIFIMLEKALKGLTDRVVAVSDSERDQAINQIGYKPDKISVVLNGSNVPEVGKVDYQFRGVIGMIGRITEQKNPLEFAYLASRIVETHPDVKFLLLGSGLHDHLLEEMHSAIRNYGLEVSFNILKWGHYDDINRFFDDIDIFVLTSKFEGSPFSLVEAMAYGLPCIASNVDGCKDVLNDHENGLLYSSKDEMVRMCEKLISDSQLRKKLGQNGRNYILKQLNTSGQVAKIHSIYKLK